MITLFAGIKFTYFFAIGLIIPVLFGLIYAYLKRSQAKRIIIPTLFILKKVTSKRSIPQSFKPPLRILFELLILLLLILACIQPYRTNYDNKIAVLLDNSLSMAALYEGETNLEIAKRYVNNLYEQADFYISDPVLKKIPRSEVKNVSISYSSADLDSQLNKIAVQNYSKVILVSDHGTQSKIEGFEVQTIKPNSRPQQQNIAITNAAINPENIKIDIAAFTTETVTAKLILESLDSEQNIIDKEAKEITIKPGRSEAIEFETNNAVAYKISLKSEANYNRLLLDDQYYLSNKKSGVINVALDSTESISALGLDQLSAYSFTKSAFVPKRDSCQLVYKKNITNNSVNTVAILANRADLDLTQASNTFTRIDRSHSISKYIDPLEIDLASDFYLNSKLNLLPVIAGTAGPLLLAGTDNNYKIASLAFNILPYTGKEQPLNSIILLNALGWACKDSTQIEQSIPGLYPDSQANLVNYNFYSEQESNLISDQNVHASKLRASNLVKNYNREFAAILMILLILDLALYLVRSK